MKIATFSSVWGSATGGIDVFNRELIKGLVSENRDIKICACLLVNTPDLEKASGEIGFISVTPDSKQVKKVLTADIGSWNESNYHAVVSKMGLLRFQPDIVVLHDIFCKRILPFIRSTYPSAKIVTFFHSSYGRSEKRKGKTDTEIDRKENFQREMLEESDLSISVGSFSEGYLSSLNIEGKEISHILPGLPKINSTTKKPTHFNAMSFGRLDSVSDPIKQISLSAKAWLAARDSTAIYKLNTSDVKFIAVGCDDSSEVLNEVKELLRNDSQVSILGIPFEDVQDFNLSELQTKMKSSAFILLTSWYENFGLTYLEACTFGIPTIISENSGFFHDLEQVIGTENKKLLISVPTNGVTEDKLFDNIKLKLIANAQNYDEVFDNAQKLSSLIKEKWPTWEEVASELLDKFADLGIGGKPEAVNPMKPCLGEQADTPPLEETVKDLLDWCWNEDTFYYDRMIEESSIASSFSYPLTRLQKAFWDRREELKQHQFRDLILCGGTSSGKTTLAEHLFGISKPLDFTRSKILYVAPTRALAQERANAWKKLFPSPNLNNSQHDTVIVSTGDNNASDGALIRGDFNIASTVYEKANVILSASLELFKKLNMVVIDEFHMIEDLHRGSILECLLAKLTLEKERRIAMANRQNPLRLVIITTEEPGTALNKFLRFKDFETLEDIDPLVITDSSRAKQITHNCIVPGWLEADSSNELQAAVFEIKTFNKQDPLLLTTEESKRACEEFEGFRTTLTHIPENHGFDSKRIRREYYKNFIEQWMRDNLYGQRLLVFMNSKYEVLEVSRFIKNSIRKNFSVDYPKATPITPNEEGIASTLNAISESVDYPKATPITPNEEGIASTLNAISEIETTDFTNDLRNCAEEGVFIHNSDVPQKVRESFEDYLGKDVPESCRSEIIFATGTLSYGVNLRVMDVAIFNILFPAGERIQTATPSHILLSHCDFTNMAGRAGRLGQSTLNRNPCVYWYLDPKDEMSFAQVLNDFYVETPDIHSRLFDRSDSCVLNKLTRYDDQNRHSNESEGSISSRREDEAIERFSYPFSRSVLDGVRFLGGKERDGGFLNQGSCSVDEVITEFISNTPYYSENCEPEQGRDDKSPITRSEKKKEELVLAVKKIIESASRSAYGLICKPATATGNYKVTPLGCSTIDTGTEIATVTKLRSSLLALNELWKDALKTDLPFELAIMPIFFQPEVNRQYLTRMPEFRLGSGIRWDAAGNRNDLINRATESLCEMQVIRDNDQDAIQRILHNFMEWILQNQPGVNVQVRYETAAQDSCLRLFVAFLAWISGASLRDVIGEIQRLYPDCGQAAASSVFNFESFAENLTWKVQFLVSLIRASNQILPDSSVFGAVRFVHRSRFGCAEEAIPLLFKNKHSNPPFNRVKVHELLRDGYSSVDIALGKLVQHEGMGAPERRKIKEHVITFIVESFQEVSRQFCHSAAATGTNTVRKANESVSKEYWDFASQQVQDMLNAVQERERWVISDSAEKETLSELIESDEKEGQLLVSRAENGVEFQTYYPVIESNENETISVRRTNQYQAYFSLSNNNELSVNANESEFIFIVDFPWATGVSSETDGYCRLSPAAFGILLSLCARDFVSDVDQYLKSIISGADRGPIGTTKLYALSEPHLQGRLPMVLFEAWARYIEVGEF